MSERPLRVLVLIHRQWDDSPYCAFVHDQVRALRARGHDVVVIAPVGTLPLQGKLRPNAARIARATPKRAVIDGVPVYYPRFLALGDVGERMFGGGLEARAAMGIAHRLHRFKPFDLLHAHMLDRDGHAGLFIARRLRIPMALTVHGTDVMRYFGEGKMPTPRNLETARAVDGLMAVSERLLALVRPYRGDGLSAVIPNGVDTSQVDPTPVNAPRQVLFAGALRAQKCADAVLEAFVALAGDYPDARLTIAGEGEERGALERRVREAGMSERVRLTGRLPREQVLRLMAQSDVFAMPSRKEGFGIVYLEAMASGCVTIGSRGEGIDGVIRDGENGLLVPAGDARAVEAALRRAFDAPDRMRALRERARADALSFTWERNAQETETFYRRVLSRSAGRAR